MMKRAPLASVSLLVLLGACSTTGTSAPTVPQLSEAKGAALDRCRDLST